MATLPLEIAINALKYIITAGDSGHTNEFTTDCPACPHNGQHDSILWHHAYALGRKAAMYDAMAALARIDGSFNV